jgi:hypothetical protein
MEKCQYILERNLPSLASADELARIATACRDSSTVRYGRSAKEAMAAWSVPESEIRKAIIRHIEAGKKVFHKLKFGSKTELIPNDVQANVTIGDDFDVYVEIAIEDGILIIIYAHDHKYGQPRLPQL